MKILFTGGGTGGHIYPALAIREAIKLELLSRKEHLDSAYMGVSGGMEEQIVKRISGLPFLGVSAQGMPRSFNLKWLSFILLNLLGIFDAFNHLRRFKPDLVVATGGFVTFPALMAAKILGIKYIIHEQNAVMGITNRFFARSAELLLLTYESAAKADGKRIIVSGNPVRSSFLGAVNTNGRFCKNNNEFWVLSVGGSRGALSINRAVVDLVKNWLPHKKNIRFLHISGERDYKMVLKEIPKPPKNYILIPYLHEMKEAFDVADLVVSRAGASILAELAVCGKPAILIPFPFATDNHQEKNARFLEKLGGAVVLLDADLSWESLANLIDRLIESNKLATMSLAMRKSRPENVEKNIAKMIMRTCNSN